MSRAKEQALNEIIMAIDDLHHKITVYRLIPHDRIPLTKKEIQFGHEVLRDDNLPFHGQRIT